MPLPRAGGASAACHARLLSSFEADPSAYANTPGASLDFAALAAAACESAGCANGCMGAVAAESIWSAWITGWVKRKHRQWAERRFDDVKEYAEKAEVTLRSMAMARAAPAVVLARMLLDAMGMKKDDVKAVIRNAPEELPKRAANLPSAPEASVLERLAADIAAAVAEGGHGSPAADAARHDAGLEHEALLYERLRAACIPFQTEDELRIRDEEKTPDAKLTLPLLMRWRDASGRANERFVHWIDSKASFCDQDALRLACASQFDTYARRFGPGLAVHWPGYVSGVDAAIAHEDDRPPSVLVTDDFPPRGVELIKLDVDVAAHLAAAASLVPKDSATV